MPSPQTITDWFQAANDLYATGRFAESADAYRHAIQAHPEFSDAYNNLANALVRTGDFPNAIGAYQRAIAIRADFVEAHHNLGALLQRMSRWQESAEAYRNALRINPALPAEVRNQLGIVLTRAGQLEPAAEAFRQAIDIRPDFPEALNNLANVYRQLHNAAEAIVCYRRAAVLRPDSAEIFNNLGNVLKETGQLDHALAAQHRATELRAGYADAYNNLANTLKDTRRLDQAIACYDAALAIDPGHAIAHSGKLYTLHFHPNSTPQSLYEAHRQWNQRHAAMLPSMPPHRDRADPNRRLRVGYVSPDFRDHVVGRFLRPLLKHHDRHQTEIFAYASVPHPDTQTGEFQTLVHNWRNVAILSDAQLAAQIYADEIDILVDLTMHMAGSRLLTFARKPAPLQLTYLAYCSTTGLEAMDYRFTDAHLDPAEENHQWYSEKSLPLRSYWCYEAPLDLSLSPKTAANITFGCLNNFCKISDATVKAWAELMDRVPNSRLVVHAHAGTHRQEFISEFSSRGIAAGRIEFIGFMPFNEYLATYQRIDIALDPFPYAGGTTTCDALWMGVPVITLAGKTAVSRSGRSLLSNVGLEDLVADTTDAYIHNAIGLAADSTRRHFLRHELRQRMIHSPLMDAPAFARDVEQAYREIWKQWCEQQ